MAYFPDSVLPKRLRKETAAEVDNSPLIFNARDYNIHEREIRAIENFLIGQTRSTSIPDGSTTDIANTSLLDLTQLAIALFKRMTDGGMITSHTGTILAGRPIPMPSSVVYSKTSGVIGAGATSIGAVSTDGFPNEGYLTKFNAITSVQLCSGNNGQLPQCPAGSVQYQGFAFGPKMTNQELIYYTSKTATTFDGCTRSVGASTAQYADDAAPAILVCGKASLMLSHNVWDRSASQNPNEFYLEHDAMLNTRAALYQEGNRKVTKSISGLIELAYSMTVSGWFDDVDVSQVFNLVE